MWGYVRESIINYEINTFCCMAVWSQFKNNGGTSVADQKSKLLLNLI